MSLRLGLGLGAVGRACAPWTPPDTAGNLLWLPASLSGLWQDSGASTPVAANGDPIGYRSELSPTGLYVVQETAGQRPTWAANSFAAGKPALSFDGIGNRLARAATCAPLRTVQLAYRLRTAAGPGVFFTPFHLATSSGACWVMHIGNGGSGYQTLSIGANTVSAAGVGAAGVCNDTDPHVITFRYAGSAPTNPASWRIRVDGVDRTVVSTGAMAVSTGNTVLGIYPSGVLPTPMEFGCLLGWDTELSGAPLTDSESYLTSLLS